jgi:hypothetical protein
MQTIEESKVKILLLSNDSICSPICVHYQT